MDRHFGKMTGILTNIEDLLVLISVSCCNDVGCFRGKSVSRLCWIFFLRIVLIIKSIFLYQNEFFVLFWDVVFKITIQNAVFTDKNLSYFESEESK